MNKQWLILGILMGLVLYLLFYFSLPDGSTLTVVFCNVGQGDASYLRFPNGVDMLIDGGPDGSVLRCLGKHKPFWDRKIKFLILSHPEHDHISGLISVLERYTVDAVLLTSVVNNTPEYNLLARLVEQQNVKVRYMTADDKIQVNGVLLSWLWPSESALADRNTLVAEYGEEHPLVLSRNDASQVIHLRYGTVDMLFSGDAGNLVSQNYIGFPLTPDQFEVLKVPHHGSASGMNDSLLQWLQPKYAVISCGKKNRYGHPAQHILHLLSAYNSTVLRTDEAGDILLKTDGAKLRFTMK